MPGLIAADVGHRYGDDEVLANIDLELGVGTTTALVGPSGSGKSTLLAVLGGLLTPLSGAVHITTPSMRRPAVGWVLQTTNALPARTVYENVRLGLLGQRCRDERQRVETAIAEVGLGHRATARTRTLSGGEVQRLSIARALVARPWFLFADEPTGQLDEATTQSVLDVLIPHDRQRDFSLLVATHDPIVAARCETVYALRDGRIVVSG